MWPFHYLLPTVEFLSSNYPKACSPPPGRQLLLPQPRTLSSSRFCTAAGAESTRGKFFAGWANMKTSLREALFCFQLCKSGCPSKHSPLCSFPPTYPSALPHVGLLPTTLPCYSLPSLHSQTCITCSFPDCPSFPNLQEGLQLWLPMPGPSPVSWLILHITAYPPDFPLSSFFFLCTEVLLCLLSVPCQHKILVPSCCFFLSVSQSPTIMSQISKFHTRFYLPLIYTSIYPDLPDLPVISYSFLLNCQFTRSVASVSWPRVARGLVILGERSMFWRPMAQQIPLNFVSTIPIMETVHAFVILFCLPL